MRIKNKVVSTQALEHRLRHKLYILARETIFVATQDSQILEVLEDLLKEEDILATMLARKGFEGTSPSPDKFKLTDVRVWTNLQNAMGDFFEIMSKFSGTGLDKIYFELGDYEVIFFIVSGRDIAVVAVIPALANKGLLEVELENARRAITKILGV